MSWKLYLLRNGRRLNRKRGTGTIRVDGYIQMKESGHPVSTAGGYLFLHRKVLWHKIGPGVHLCFHCATSIEWFKGLECDHLDHNKQNNDPENLVPCCRSCNRARWNRGKTGCPKEGIHGPYDKFYKNGTGRYCSKCKCEKEKRRRDKRRLANEGLHD